MRVAHLSDIHFFENDLSKDNFFSKDLLGTLNSWVNRSRSKITFDIFSVPKVLKEKKVTHVIITGDFTTTSNLKEYAQAKRFIDKLKDQDLEVLFIPGNHDTYSEEAERSKRFYEELEASKSLRDEGIDHGYLGANFHYILLDTTLATPFWSSQGLFSERLEEKLTSLLSGPFHQKPVVLINHFPVQSQKRMPLRHQMVRFEKLKEIIENHVNIKLYLFGHTHLSEMIQNRALLLNSGSLRLTSGGSFNIMDLCPSSVTIEAYTHEESFWKIKEKKRFSI